MTLPPEIVELVEIAGPVLGALLTLAIFSYLAGDNPVYRLALHLFIGTLMGYAVGVAFREVLLKMVLFPLRDNPLLLIPLVMGLWLLFFKSIPRLAYAGNFSVAYIVGVGAAVALSGALLGTIIPQVEATGRVFSYESWESLPLGPLDGAMILVGTICTLMVFNFTLTAPRRYGLTRILAPLVGAMAWLGKLFLLVALGAAFAGALTASLSIFIGRLQHLIDVFTETIYPYIVGG